jgi:hypothetical protein
VGVDEVVLNTTGVCQVHGIRQAMADMETILASVAR